MKLNTITVLILAVTTAIDTGKYQNITIREVEEHIERGDLLDFLRGRCGDDLILGPLVHHTFDAELRQIVEGLQGLLRTHRGDERRKWGVQNSGLCLLVAWSLELIAGAER